MERFPSSRTAPLALLASGLSLLPWSGHLLGADAAPGNQELLQRIEQLEREVKALRQAAGSTPATAPNALPQVKIDPAYNPNRLDDLEQKIRVVERKSEIAAETAAESTRNAPVVTAGPNGFQIRSSDTNFVLRLRGYVQADARFFPDDHAAGTANDTFLMRRVRPILEGTVYDRYDFRLMLDFASGITSSAANNGFVQDAYVNARIRPEFQLQAGKFKEPVGL
jgi:hypothetical protein